MQTQTHPDGSWRTTVYHYKNRKILIKAKKTKGMKCHVFYPGSAKVEFTLRYSFISPSVLLEKAKSKVDKIYSKGGDQ